MGMIDKCCSWMKRRMGGQVTVGEIFFSMLLLSLLLAWPLVAFGTLFLYDRSSVPLAIDISRWVVTFVIWLYPVYIIPLLIMAKKMARKHGKALLFYIISGAPIILLALSILLSVSPLAQELPKGADFFTYKRIGDDIDGSYSKDKNHVYYMLQEVKGADAKTFQVMTNEGDYAVDKNHVYYLGEVLKGADPTTFKVGKNGKAYDGKDYFIYGKPYHVADYKTFRMGKGNWDMDCKYAYYVGEDVQEEGAKRLRISDWKSFKGLNELYAKDNKQVYFQDKVVQGADAATFFTYKDNKHMGQDKTCVYYDGQPRELKDYRLLTPSNINDNYYTYGQSVYNSELLKMPSGTDLKHLQSLDYTDWSKDLRHVYWKNRLVKGADPATFSPLPSLLLTIDSSDDVNKDNDYGRDATHIYYREVMLKDADYNSFICGWDAQEQMAFAFDKHRYYEGHPTPLIRRIRSLTPSPSPNGEGSR